MPLALHFSLPSFISSRKSGKKPVTCFEAASASLLIRAQRTGTSTFQCRTRFAGCPPRVRARMGGLLAPSCRWHSMALLAD